MLPSLYMLPLYTSLVCFLLREIGGFRKRKEREGGGEGERDRQRERERERERENKQTYLLCF
jgi:hypothetical protein